ncbi:hypothetical protein D3C77_431310 [compost metagenome]
MSIQSIIADLAQKGVIFQASHPGPYGTKSIPLPAEDVTAYSLDPVDYIAKYYGITKVQYLNWHRSSFCVLCSDTTIEGNPCRNIVPGGNAVDSPQRWVALQGEYCHVHQNGSAR